LQWFQLVVTDNTRLTKEPKLEIDGVRQIEMHVVERAKANPGLCIDQMLYRKVVVVRIPGHMTKVQASHFASLSRQAEVIG